MSFDDEKITVARGMVAFGGSFAKKLGEALYCADKINTFKIYDTWPDLWRQYLGMGESLE